MKSTIEHHKPPLAVFPRLRVSKGGDVVLFTDPYSGTVVHSAGSTHNPLGMHSTDWAPEFFTDFCGTIILED